MTIRARLFLLLTPPLVACFLLAFFFFYFNGSKEWLLLGSCITILLVIGAVFLIADRITKPVRQLSQAAMKIAAGDYGTHLVVEGPKEIVELSNTFNTMSQCLVENISRLKESSLVRERMYGEYECALLLQEFMLEKVIENHTDEKLHLQLISPPVCPTQKGLLLKMDSPRSMSLIEAIEPGFSGLFELNQCMHEPLNSLQKHPFLKLDFDTELQTLSYKAHYFAPPLVWSQSCKSFIKPQEMHFTLDDPVIIFLTNSEVQELFVSQIELETWLSRTLRHFAKDGLEIVKQMITKELLFFAKKQRSKRDLKMIAIEIHRHG